MTVTYSVTKNQKPTPEQIAEIREAAKHPIVFDEDCPETGPEMLEELRQAAVERNRMLVSLGLPLPSENSENRTEATEEQRQRIDDFWKARRERQRKAAKKRLA